jgi:hypothetical protein
VIEGLGQLGGVHGCGGHVQAFDFSSCSLKTLAKMMDDLELTVIPNSGSLHS